ncbi:ferredoxin family protein [Nocardia otitidiscaviarum]|uniref:Ferredoxin n=1 Tax=Nocardia otitidiscaviarum TaxID=1823 RepID=A0A516NQV6_9NOCA|nr:ferredoxin [Nocardia otitidiscaviarum]MBF6133240.1 ferredoxin family protein [Nocardia otitidiscaviarum]MBF6181862.1 ferredoxin family protein [Nocardia otitidiscaviarum]MBF6240965.1 ferredoxin family protein [Nocardia otitidiscaviarum]MBF6486636.1 ferredoxin family protein [Nocardia otitidiscaviarum]MCP9620453.1 ferredoxin family protein [Nocardia otitidiscaviarum]
MTYVIGADCVDVLDRACVEECPVNCIYVGDRMAYIQPDECVDCSACEPACPVEAIYYEDDVPAGQEEFVTENARFFSETLPGRDEPLGIPGGPLKFGEAVGVDTPFVARFQR